MLTLVCVTEGTLSGISRKRLEKSGVGKKVPRKKANNKDRERVKIRHQSLNVVLQIYFWEKEHSLEFEF